MFEQMKMIQNKKLLVYGDYMVDQYIDGDISRISPEAPVPVLNVKKKWSKLGGAANVAENLISIGASVRTLGCVGNDEAGKWMIEEIGQKGIDTNFLYSFDDVKTIRKTRVTSRKQQFIRLDEEDIKDVSDEFVLIVKDRLTEIFEDIDLLILSDYAKGAVTEKIAQMLISYAKSIGIPVLVDPKGKDYAKYQGATMVTPNMKELSDVTGHTISSEEDILESCQNLRNTFDFQYLVVTRSEKGISVVSESEKRDFPAVDKDVVDVSGAGDTVISAIAALYACHIEIGECCRLANIAASIVCSKFGTATLTMNEWLGNISAGDNFKYVSLNTAKYIVRSLKENGKKIVFTNGCFDLLHAGHLSSFAQAKSFGDVLIVAVNSDSSVKRLKGEDRPIIDEENRIKMLCALEYIDYVVLMEDDNPMNIIRTLQPDITVKGKDWENKYLPEREIVESYGGEVKFIDLNGSLSTTNIIHKILGEQEEEKK